MKKRQINTITLSAILMIFLTIPVLSACAAYDKAMEQFGNTEQLAHEFVENRDEALSEVEDGLKQSGAYTAGEAIVDYASGGRADGESGGVNENGEQTYYDAKSGQYVTRAQVKANSAADSLKKVWAPISVISFVIGFLIRRFVHSSATIRRIGLVFEIAVPLLMTIVVYAVCGAADSNLVHYFDIFF